MAPLTSLHRLLDALDAHIAVLDGNGTIVMVNRAWRRFGERNGLLMERHAIGSNYLAVCDAAEGSHSEGAAEVAHGLREVLAGNRLSFDFEYASPGPSRSRWFRMHAAPVEPGLGSGAVVAHWEITPYVLGARQLRDERMAALFRFAGGVAHHYNNILAIVLGFGMLLREDLPADAHTRRYLDEILQASQRGTELGSKLLAFCGQPVTHPQPLDVNALVAEAREHHWVSLPRGVQLRIELDPSVREVQADPQQIMRVLDALISNALDATGSGGTVTVMTEDVTIHEDGFTAPHPGRYVAIRVRDTGPGIPPEVLEHALEPFFTTKEIGQGAGLGLSVAYGLVKQNGGYLVAESEVGCGSSFSVLLPRVEAGVEPNADAPTV